MHRTAPRPPQRQPRPRRAIAAALAMALLLGGCATYRVDSQVRSYASWPQAGMVPATPQVYRFERLPSQRDGDAAAAQSSLEEITRAALARAGWNLSETPATAPWTVQVSAGTLKLPRAPWEEPWDGWGGGVGVFAGSGGHWGSSVFLRMDIPYYERQVSLVIRQAGTGQVVYETRARHDGRWNSSPELWSAMLDAALRDFPNPPAGPRQVNIDLPR